MSRQHSAIQIQIEVIVADHKFLVIISGKKERKIRPENVENQKRNKKLNKKTARKWARDQRWDSG